LARLFEEALNKPILDFSEHEKQKRGFCFSSFFKHFVFEKWRHLPVPQELLV